MSPNGSWQSKEKTKTKHRKLNLCTAFQLRASSRPFVWARSGAGAVLGLEGAGRDGRWWQRCANVYARAALSCRPLGSCIRAPSSSIYQSEHHQRVTPAETVCVHDNSTCCSALILPRLLVFSSVRNLWVEPPPLHPPLMLSAVISDTSDKLFTN